MRLQKILLLSLLVLTFCITNARADGIDLDWFFTFAQVPDDRPLMMAGFVAGVMLFNYLLNLIVIGLPAMFLSPLKRSLICRELIWLTLAGQLADRLGAGLAAFLETIVSGSYKGLSDHTGTGLLLALPTCALFIGGLVFYFCFFRWKMGRKHALLVAVSAGLLTNPAIMIFALIMLVAWSL